EPESSSARAPVASSRSRHTSRLARPPSGGADTRIRSESPWTPFVSERDAPGTTQQSTTTPSGWRLRKGASTRRSGRVRECVGVLAIPLVRQFFGHAGRFVPAALGQGGPVGEEGHLVVEDLEEPTMHADRGAPVFA